MLTAGVVYFDQFAWSKLVKILVYYDPLTEHIDTQ